MKNKRYLLDAIKNFQPEFIAAWEKAVSNSANEVPITELTTHLRQGNLLSAIALVEASPESFIDVEDAVRQAHRNGFDATAGAIPRIMRDGSPVVMRLSPRNFRAEAWLVNHSATLIKGLTETARDTIRAHLVYGVENGINPRKVALQLLGQKGRDGVRRGGVIGLTPKQLQTVQSYRAALESGDYSNALGRSHRNKLYDKMLKSGKKLDTATVDKIVDSYSNNSLKYRATVIAEQETRVAMAEARTETFKQTVEKGYLNNDEIRRFWITRRDSRVRDSHDRIPGMNKDGVNLNQPFNTPDGAVYDAPHGIGCRCYVDVRITVNR